MTHGPPPGDVRRAVDALARGLSLGTRRGGELVVGPSAALTTDLHTVFVPWPLAYGDADARSAAMLMVALQCAPTKHAAASLPLGELTPRQKRAVSIREGAAALGWLADRWPGLSRHAAAWIPLDPAPWRELEPEALAEDAIRLAARARGDAIDVPWLLGELPLRPEAGDALREFARRARSRMPFSLERTVERVRATIQIPVGGRGGEQAPENGPPEGYEPPEFGPASGVGMLYDEWDVHRQEYRADFVTVVEGRASVGVPERRHPDRTLEPWFSMPLQRRWTGRLEDGIDIDVDAIVDAHGDPDGQGPRRFYRDRPPGSRDAAFALLLDVSGSLAQGSLLRQELRCADALADAMVGTGERFGVFSFWSDGRTQVHVDVVRGFGARSSRPPSAARLVPRGYTRLGAPIRHVTAKLRDVDVTRRALLVLTDGLPSDDGYEGPYACHDVAKAVEEAEVAGVAVMVLGVGVVDDDPLADLLGERIRRLEGQGDLTRAVAEVHRRLMVS
ncbi:MAG: nitric oxide reductase activation protein NorD [Solirubrobacteraceae bacterium]